MRPGDFALHVAPAGMAPGRIKKVDDSASHAEEHEKGEAKQRNQNAHFVRHITEISQQDFEQRFPEPDPARRDRQRDDRRHDGHDREHIKKGNTGPKGSR